MIKKIVISGIGGQGIKLITHILGIVLVELGFNVSIDYDYDSAVHGGKMVAMLIYSDKKIKNPIVEEADILLWLSEKGDKYVARRIVCDEGLGGKNDTEIEIPFTKLSLENFKTKNMTNMVALGKLLSIIGIDINHVHLKEHLPKKFRKQDFDAIKLGFTYRDDAHYIKKKKEK